MRGIKKLEIVAPCKLVALCIAAGRNTMAAALSRFGLHLCGRDPYPGRQMHAKFRELVETTCGLIDVGAMATDSESNV